MENQEQKAPQPTMETVFPIYLHRNGHYVCILTEKQFVAVQLMTGVSISSCGENESFVLKTLADETYTPIARETFVQAIITANGHFQMMAIIENKIKA